ncbi:MAG: ribosomal protection-like ABC-F family protein [Halanaerobiales bacterium]
MQLLSCRNIYKNFADQKVLEGINIDINEGEVIGLVGTNGAGKTTLANIISGAINPDGGEIIKHVSNLKIGYLLQSTYYTEEKFNGIFNKKAQTEIGDFFEVTSYLGLDEIKDWQGERLNNLSGGEKTKLALADIWIEKPDLLILDEPTNHLDIKGIEWLIDEIDSFRGACLIISHDRYFLDQVVETIIEIENGNNIIFQGNYTFYREEKQRRYQEQLQQYQVQKKKERKLNKQINQLDRWSTKAHNQSRKKAIDSGNKFGGKEFNRVKAKKRDQQVKSKLKRLEKMKEEGVKKPTEEPEVLFRFNISGKRGKRLIEARNITKGFEDNILFEGSSFYINHGDRIGIYGENGCGKSTLIRVITCQDKVDIGELWVSPSLSFSYLSQDVMDLDEKNTILETLAADKFYNDRERALLANMGFEDKFLDKKIESLSPGERTKVKLAELILEKRDCLILDEPNNHLDLYSREQLEDTLDEYPGTIILVSHDRYLLEKITDCMLIFENKRIRRVERGFKAYIKSQREKAKMDKSKKELLRDKMIIENRITAILSKIGSYNIGDSEYEELDQEFQKLIKERKTLNTIS